MNPIKLCEQRRKILATDGHILIEGGPGSGKTTIALLKANKIVESGQLRRNQKVLFLSFARATITRIEEQAANLITSEGKKIVEINTYHSFCWNIIQSFGYLISTHRYFKLITPPAFSAVRAGIPDNELDQLKRDLFDKEGTVCFDLFAEVASDILDKSSSISNIISGAYPVIIVDEFQDTDRFEWKLIRRLGVKSKIIALADLDQRIYDFRGASVTRVPEFIQHFECKRFNLGKENNRSSNTDIAVFGDDLLTGANKGKQYEYVKIIHYPYYSGEMYRVSLKTAVISSIKRLRKPHRSEEWSIAILVKTKQDTLSVSNYLQVHNLDHEVIIDPAGPSLAAGIISIMLQPPAEPGSDTKVVIQKLVNHIRGRKGDKPSQKDIKLAAVLEQYLETGKIRGTQKIALVREIELLVSQRCQLQFSGVPGDDWLAIRKLFQDATSDCLRNVYDDARYLKLLHKGALLNERLAGMWRDYGCYSTAGASVEDALVQEHFSLATRKWKGIFVMNIHKSKGKEFDEVIIWEELYKPIVYKDSISQGRLLLRVAATRARSLTTFLTPVSDPCILL